MTPINLLAIVAAGIVAFLASGAYYAALASRAARYSAAWADASGQPAWKLVHEPFRALVTVSMVALVAAMAGVDDVAAGVSLAGVLWIGFPAMLLVGSVIHENVPWQLAVTHAGDWLVKLVIIGAIVGAWH